MNVRHPAFLLLPAALILTAGLPASARGTDARGTDARIEAAAKGSYNFQALLKDDDIAVHAQDGAVILEGRVCDRYHRTLAEATVAGIPGVKKVTNNLELKGQQAEETSDAWLTTKVKGALLLHRKVSGLATEVETRGGTVQLRGKASSQAEKDLAGKIAGDIDGVKAVQNDLVVSNERPKARPVGQKLDDASITAQVKAALLLNRSTHALTTRVETRAGKVTVEGEAANRAEKDLVTELVKDVNGVQGLTNRMTIRP